MPVLLNQRERHGGFPVHAGQLALTVLGFLTVLSSDNEHLLEVRILNDYLGPKLG